MKRDWRKGKAMLILVPGIALLMGSFRVAFAQETDIVWRKTVVPNILSLAYSPDGTKIASVGNDGIVRIWDVETGDELRDLTRTSGITWMNSLIYSPDGSKIALADGDVEIWDANTGILLQTLTAPSLSLRSVAYSPDGTRLATGTNNGPILIWDANTGALLQTLTGHTGEVLSVAYSPDGSKIASGSSDYTIKIWDANTGALLQTHAGNTGWVYTVAYSPDGTKIASGGWNSTINIWDANTGALLQTLTGHTDSVYSVAYSPDGTKIASGSADRTIKIWNANTGALLQTLTGHTREVLSVAYSPDGSKMASGGADQTIIIWTSSTGTEVRTIIGLMSTVYTVAYSPDGTRIASGGLTYNNTWTSQIWDAGSGQLIQTFTDMGGGSVVFSPDGMKIASARDKNINILDVNTGALLRTLTGHTDSVFSVAFSPDGSRLASGSFDKSIRIWDVETGSLIRVLTGHTGIVNSVAYSPDGSKIASGSSDYTIKIWDANTGALLQTLTGHTDSVYSVAYSPDGTKIASGSADRTIKIWNANTGALLQTLTGHTREVLSVAYSPDGSKIASGSDDLTVKIWDAETGAEIRTLTGHTGLVRSVAYSPDGVHIISGGYDGIILWLPGSPVNLPPSAPSLSSPADTEVLTSLPSFALSSTDPESGLLRYKIELSQDNFSTLFRVYDQTQSSLGWNKPSYASGEVARLDPPAGDIPEGNYSWRAYAFDGVNWSVASEIRSFTYLPPQGLQISTIFPKDVIAHPGFQTLQIGGQGFIPGTTQVWLEEGSTRIDPSAVNILSSFSMEAVFDFTGVSIGPYDLVVAIGTVQARKRIFLFPYIPVIRISYFNSPTFTPGRNWEHVVTLVNYGTAPAVAVVGVLIPPGLELRGVVGGQVLAQTPEGVLLLAQRVEAGSGLDFRLILSLPWSNIVPPGGTKNEGQYYLGDPIVFPYVLLASPTPEAWDVVQQNSASVDDILQGAHWGSLLAGGYVADAYLNLTREEREEYITRLGDRYPYVADALVTDQLDDFGFFFSEKTGLGLEEFTSPSGFGPRYHGGNGTIKDIIQDAWWIMKATGVGAWEDLTSADRAAALLGFGEGFVEGVTFGFYRPNLGATTMAHISGLPPDKLVGYSSAVGNLTSMLVPSGQLAEHGLGWGVNRLQNFIPRPNDIYIRNIKIALHGTGNEPVHYGLDWVAGGAERNILHFGVHTQFGPHLGFGWSSELVPGTTNIFRDGLHLYPGHSFIPGFGDVNVGFQQLAAGYNAYKNIRHPPQNPGFINEGSVPMIRASYDPNHIDSIPMGPYILPNTRLVYFIQFENTGNLEAQDVTITLPLDEDLDMSTLSLDGSSHPTVLETIVDQNTRTITWQFRGIHLPPNQNPPEGEGWVRLSIFPNADVASGAEILHKATIVFDTNPPIETNESRLVVDRDPPTSNVKPLQPVYYTTTFSVPFDASDATSGIKTVELWYARKPIEPVFGPQDLSRNGYQFSRYGVWEIGSQPQEFQFTGEFGYEYRFFTMAFDQVGNGEWEETQIDALTSIPVPAIQVVKGSATIPTTAKKSDVNVPMLQFVVKASQSEGERIEGLSLKAEGDGDDRNDILSVKVWVDSNGNGKADDGGSPIAQGVFPANDGSVTFLLPYPRTIPPGQSETYLVTYDFAQTLAFALGSEFFTLPSAPLSGSRFPLPFVLLALAFLPVVAIRRLRYPAMVLLLTTGLLWLTSCGGGGGGAPAVSRSYKVVLTSLLAKGASSNADATLSGIPISGSVITVQR